ncbi:MAG: hypothetical protein K2P80_07700 [Beijerinckiaceae bacterium]|nr:hypothetical protein [Beijerinckiaceae bacterium]
MNILKYAVIAASAFTGVAMTTLSASAMPVAPHGSELAVKGAEEARLVCNRFGRCVRVGPPARVYRGYGRPYRGYYGRPYRRGYYR